MTGQGQTVYEFRDERDSGFNGWFFCDCVNCFHSVDEMLRSFFWREEYDGPYDPRKLWDKLWQHPWQGFDPLRITPVNYRPFDTRWTYYSDRKGLIGSPRYNTERHLNPWYWWYTLLELRKEMPNYTSDELRRIVADCEEDALQLPLNWAWMANFNMWRAAVWTLAEREAKGNARQLDLFGG